MLRSTSNMLFLFSSKVRDILKAKAAIYGLKN